MKITESEGREWREWVLVTSIPLVRLCARDTVQELGSSMLICRAERKFVLTVEHVVKRDETGWAVVVQQDGRGQMEYYRPNFFSYVGEMRLSSGDIRLLDLCAAQVAADLETWYEYRTPRGLFDRRPHHVFDSDSFAEPDQHQVYGFSGRVRTEKHGADTFVSDMVVYPGLRYSHSEEETHCFKLPVAHPGHYAFQGCSGSPIVDMNRKVVALVVSGDPATNMIKGVAINRVIPNLEFLASGGGI